MKGEELWGWIALILLIIGGINWGIVGLFHVDIIDSVLGNLLSRLIYILVGVAAGYKIYLLVKKKKEIL